MIMAGKSKSTKRRKRMTQDRNRTVMIKGKQVNFVFLGSEAKIPFDKVTSVSVIPFTKAGDVV